MGTVKLYLSSFRVGNQAAKLKELAAGRTIAGQAMRLSGFDELITGMTRTDFLYAGYSAGVCVLAPRLDGLQQVDDPTLVPYPNSTVVREGLGMLDYLILPHFESDHPESADIDRAVEYCRRNGIAFRTLRDGEVIVIGRSA